MACTASQYLSRAMMLTVLACGVAKADLVQCTDYTPASAETPLLTLAVQAVSSARESLLHVDRTGLDSMEFNATPAGQQNLLLMGGVVPALVPAKLNVFRESGPMVLFGTALLLLSRLARARSQGRG
jgi:hypothetical protein